MSDLLGWQTEMLLENKSLKARLREAGGWNKDFMKQIRDLVAERDRLQGALEQILKVVESDFSDVYDLPMSWFEAVQSIRQALEGNNDE